MLWVKLFVFLAEKLLTYGWFKSGTFFVSSIILQAKHELTSKVANKSVILRLLQVRPAKIAKECQRTFFWIVLQTLKTIKLRTLFQRDTNNCKAIMISPVRGISGRVTICLLGDAGKSDHMISNNNNILSYVIRREERIALKDRSLTSDNERSWFEPTIRS